MNSPSAPPAGCPKSSTSHGCTSSSSLAANLGASSSRFSDTVRSYTFFRSRSWMAAIFSRVRSFKGNGEWTQMCLGRRRCTDGDGGGGLIRRHAFGERRACVFSMGQSSVTDGAHAFRWGSKGVLAN